MPAMSEHGHHHDRSDKHAVHLALVQRLRAQAAEMRAAGGGSGRGCARDAQRARQMVDEGAGLSLPADGDDFRRALPQHADRRDDASCPTTIPTATRYFVALTQRPTADVLAEYLGERDALCRTLEGLTPAEWHRKARHPQFPHYDLHFQAEYMAHHEAHHIYQLFQRRVPFGKLPH